MKRTTMTAGSRAELVRFQQKVAPEAFMRGRLSAARLALRILRPDDSIGDASVGESLLAVLRDQNATENQVLRAVSALVHLRPAGDS